MYTWLASSVRAKIVTIVFISTIVITITVYITATTLIRSSYADIEHAEMVQNLQQADDAFQSDVDAMWIKIKDWGFWDDLYVYALNPDKGHDFEEANFNDNGLSNLDINMVMLIDHDGKIAYKKVIDTQTGSEVADSQIPNHLLEAARGIVMPADANAEMGMHGIVLLPEGPMLVASVAILRTDRAGPNAGSLVFARFIDSDSIKHIAEITHLSLIGFPYESTDHPSDVAAAKKELVQPHSYVVQPLSENRLAGYSALYSINGKPIFILRVDTPRQVYNQGKFVLLGLTILIGFALLVFGFFTFFLMEKYVVARLSRLSGSVRKIGENRDLSARVEEGSRDEVGTLATAINTMLSDLSMAQTKESEFVKSEKESADKLKEHTQEIERLNEIMSGREQKMAEMRNTIQNLKKQLGEA